MGPQEEILSEFIQTLEQTEAFPPETLQRLKELLAQGTLGSKSDLRDAIDRGKQHALPSEVD